MSTRKAIFLHGSLVCIVLVIISWIFSMSSSMLFSPHHYMEQQNSFDHVALLNGVPSAMETRQRFHKSDISSFLSAFDHVTGSTWTMHDRPKLVLMCIVGKFGLCGGIGDRIMGIPYAVALALLSGRQLTIHPSLLSNGPIPQNVTTKTHYQFIDGSCTRQNVESLMKATTNTIFVTVNCEPLNPSPPFASMLETQQDALQNIHEECSPVSYLCGAAAIHSVGAFKEGIDTARRLVAAMPMLSYRNYTALHVRAGGSMLTLDNTYKTKALRWQDGHASDVPQLWLDAFRGTPFLDCQKHLALVSDSVRLISELEFTAGDGLMITRCCSQPLHRDRTHRQGFFLQEVIDLFLLAHSRKIVGGYGGFAVLGRYWLGKQGPEMVVAKTKVDIEYQVEAILRESECRSSGA